MSIASRIFKERMSQEERSSLVTLFQTWQEGTESLVTDFESYVRLAYKDNGVVFAVILARMLLLSEARFTFRERGTKAFKPTDALKILETPWPNGTTGDLIARMEQDASLAGNAYVRKVSPTRLQRLRPDLVDIIHDGLEIIGYLYWPKGRNNGSSISILVEDMCHWAPIPDPWANFRGMSWLTPVVREIDADTLMSKHKGKFFENAATPNLVVSIKGKLPPGGKDRLEAVIKEKYESWENAYKTLLIEGGADVTVVGNSFQEIAFTELQAAGENRIAAAGGTPGIVVGLKEGLDAATYSNYGQARRRWADITIRPLWRSAAAALAPLVRVPANFELWYDDTDIPALAEDAKEAALIQKTKAEAAALLIRVGYVPGQVGAVVDTGRGLAELEHTGNIPVTLYSDDADPDEGKQSPDDQGASQ